MTVVFFTTINHPIHQHNRSWDSSVGIVTGYGLDDQGVGVQIPVGSRIFTSPIVQTSSGVHPTSYTMATGALSRG
jgi:hypothetical protein